MTARDPMTAFAIVDVLSGLMDGWYYSDFAAVRRLANDLQREYGREFAVVSSTHAFPISPARRLRLEALE